MGDIDEVIGSAVDEAEASTAAESAPAQEEPEAAADAVPGDTGEQEEAAEKPTEEAQGEGEEPVAGQEKNFGPVTYTRFAEVNTKKNQYEGTLKEVFQSPEKYREMYKSIHGVDPFEAAAPAATQQQEQADPVEALVAQVLPPDVLAKTEDDFAYDEDWQAHLTMVSGLRKMAELVAGVVQYQQTSQQSAEQAKQAAIEAANIREAKTIFDTTVAEIEAEYGETLTDQQKHDLLIEASKYGSSLTPKEALDRTVKFMFFDKAKARGRDEAARIREQKEAASGGRPGSAGGAGGSSARGLSLDDAISRACAEHGIH